MKTVETRYSADEFAKADGQESLRIGRVMQQLREKGVPVIGKVTFVGVEYGVMTFAIEEGLDGDEYVYRWTGTPKKVAAPVEDDEL